MSKLKDIRFLPILLVIIIFAQGVVMAAGNYYFYYTAPPDTFQCNRNNVRSTGARLSYNMPYDAESVVVVAREYVNGTVYYSYSTNLGYGSTQADVSFPIISANFSTQTYPYTWSVTFDVLVDSSIISRSALTVECTGPQSGTVVSNTLSFDVSGGDASPGVLPPDNRLNWGYGDSNIAVLYPTADGIYIYDYNLDLYLKLINEDDVAPYEDNAPEENTLIASVGSVDVYMLTTGELQFNIGPDAEGKAYAIIMEDLSGSNWYGYEL